VAARAAARPPRRSVTRDGVRGGGGAVSASIRRRRAGCLDRPPPAAPHRRCDGAPASPLRHLARTRTARRSQACGDQAGDGLSSLHLPRRDEGARRVGPPCAALNLRRLRALGVAAAIARLPRAVNPRSVTAQHGSGGAVAAPMMRRTGRSLPDPVSSGAESKRRRCPRSRARQSRGTLLACLNGSYAPARRGDVAAYESRVARGPGARAPTPRPTSPPPAVSASPAAPAYPP